MKNHQLINQSSGNVEYYTPLEIVDAARRAMEGLDLDPASCVAANQRIQAPKIFTVADDGLAQQWFGRIWLNHPFQRGRNHVWISKLVSEYKNGHIEAACCITFASSSEAWFRPLLQFPQCWLYKRTNYYLPDGSVKRGATKGSVVSYLGREPHRFYENFKHLGEVRISVSGLIVNPLSEAATFGRKRRAA